MNARRDQSRERKLRIAYANANFKRNDTRGRNAHIGQFITNTVALGHEVWGWSGNEHPEIRMFPRGRLARLLKLRQVDVLYVRLQENPPGVVRYSLSPNRQIMGSPVIVWEFNTVPEFNRVMGRSENTVQQSIEAFRHYGQGCNLAICVSKLLSDYIRNKLGISHVLIVPNGSDPELFNPDVSPVKRINRNANSLNVVWIGSADLAWHDFDLMHDAACLLWERGEGARITFHLIGRNFGSMRDIPPNVHYYGSESYEILPHWLSAMDVGLCLYRSGPADFNSPLKLFDYMASGLAVVGTPQPQIKEVFDQLGQTDLLVPTDDPEMLARILVKLALNRDRVRSLGLAGRRLVIKFYNWKRVVRDIFDGINTMLDERR